MALTDEQQNREVSTVVTTGSIRLILGHGQRKVEQGKLDKKGWRAMGRDG